MQIDSAYVMSNGDPQEAAAAAASSSVSVRVLVEGEEVLFDHQGESGTGTVRLSGSARSSSEHNQVSKRGMERRARGRSRVGLSLGRRKRYREGGTEGGI